MRYAVISDIHGNQEALEAVLKDLENRNVDHKICLGDIVGYCAGPSECIALLEDFKSVLKGNHDFAIGHQDIVEKFNFHARVAIEWTIANLTDDEKKYLANLPYVFKDGKTTFVHATPREPEGWGYITNLEEAIASFRFFDGSFCLLGHTHFPVVVSEDGGVFKGEDLKNKTLTLEKEKRYLINVGSVGQPRDGDPRACFVILDSEKNTLEYVRLEYDLDGAQQKMRKAKLPEFLINRLAEGR